jgi:hypothetical protein
MPLDFSCDFKGSFTVGDLTKSIRLMFSSYAKEVSWDDSLVRVIDESNGCILDKDFVFDDSGFDVRVCIFDRWLLFFIWFPHFYSRSITVNSGSGASNDSLFWGIIVSGAIAECTGSRLVDAEQIIPGGLPWYTDSQEDLDYHRLEDVLEWLHGEGGKPYVSAAVSAWHEEAGRRRG